MSLPTRERELKRLPDLSGQGCAGSLPTRERELKPSAPRPLDRLRRVAPYTGA